VKFLRNALDVIQTIHSYNEFNTLKFPLKCSDAFLHLWLLEAFFEFFWVYANWESANCNHLALKFNAIGSCRKATGPIN
jgi:hypothetical protein